MNTTSKQGTRRERFRQWWDREVKVRVKALVYTAIVLIVLVTSFQVQNFQLNNQRVKDVEQSQIRACEIRIQTRKDLRETLFYFADISDVLPDNEKAEAYTANRIQFVNDTFPEITKADC